MMETSWSCSDYWNDRFRDGDTPWDLGEPTPILKDLEVRLDIPKQAHAIVPGCGRGHDALYFSERGYLVSAVDWSSDALDDLRVVARRREFEMETLLSSLWEIPESWHGTFDLWVEHTFFCAIPAHQREDYVQQALKLLKPKGHLVGVFFVDETAQTQEGPPFFSSEKEIRNLFEPHFKILKFEPSKIAPRGPFEWAAHFRAR